MYNYWSDSGGVKENIKKKVLIIDDEKDLCLLLKAYLAKYNFEVTAATTLSEGLKLLQSVVPDVLLLDNNLPDGLGWNVAPKLAQQYPNMKIQFISAYRNGIPEMPKNAKYNIIEKPIKISELSAQLLD